MSFLRTYDGLPTHTDDHTTIVMATQEIEQYSATARALNIPELLDMILLDTDPVTLLRCLRLNRFYYHFIISSRRIRCALWLDLPPKPATSANHDLVLEVNPFFVKYTAQRFSPSLPVHHYMYPQNNFLEIPVDRSRSASWRNMFVCRPNPTVQAMVFAQHMYGDLEHEAYELYEPLAMGEALNRLKCRGRRAMIGIRWWTRPEMGPRFYRIEHREMSQSG